MAQFVQHLLEARAFGLQAAEQGLAAQAHLRGDRIHAGSAGVQDRHQQALDAAARGFRILELLEQALGMVGKDAEGIARLDLDALRDRGVVHENRVARGVEGDRGAIDAIVFGAIGRLGMRHLHGADALHHAETARRADHPREGRLGELGEVVRIGAVVDQPGPGGLARHAEAVRSAVELDDQAAIAVELHHHLGKGLAGMGEKAHHRELRHVAALAIMQRQRRIVRQRLPARIKATYFVSAMRLS